MARDSLAMRAFKVANSRQIALVSILAIAILAAAYYHPWSRFSPANPSSSSGGNSGSGYTTHDFNIFVSGEQWSGQVTSDGHTVFDGSGYNHDSCSVTGY